MIRYGASPRRRQNGRGGPLEGASRILQLEVYISDTDVKLRIRQGLALLNSDTFNVRHSVQIQAEWIWGAKVLRWADLQDSEGSGCGDGG